jgi:solute:Na+ symporter, SSS family
MGLSTIDTLIICCYLAGVTIAGASFSRRQKSSREYFLGGKTLPWWSVGFSIVASETSSLTFISIPGLAYKSDMHFLQVAIGYFIGRLLVSVVFIPAYYSGDLETAYDFIGKRFGSSLRRLTSTIFIITRVFASGVRLFATAIPVHLITGLGYGPSILIIGAATLLYTYLGGLRAVVTMDVVQLFVYLSGAVASMVIILHGLPNGWSDVVAAATAGGTNKFEIFNIHWEGGWYGLLTSPYTIAGGLLGGTFLTMASHGTDQLLVQRLLGCRTARDSQKALMLDAVMIVLQFAFFLILGLCLYAFYHGVPFHNLGLSSSDEIFPKFILDRLPVGLIGLLVSGVLASAMGSLSSSISSLASSTYLDLVRPAASSPEKEIAWSRFFTFLWGLLLIGGAMLFTGTNNPVVEIGLTIASFTYGGLLGTFFLGLFFRKASELDAIAGCIAGLLVMGFVFKFTRIDFTWYTLIGCATTVLVGNATRFIRPFHKSG